MKKLRFLIPLIFVLGLLAVPTLVFAHQQNLSQTVFYACEAPNTVSTSIVAGQVDANSITQDSSLDCSKDPNFATPVQWNVKGDKGDTGATGTQGSSVLTSSDVPTDACTTGDADIDLSNGEVYSCVNLSWTDTGHTVKGDKGDTGSAGPAGIPFSHAACADAKLTGSAEQENMVFCQSGIQLNSLVYTTAINAAKVRVMVGTPISALPSIDWGGRAITYVSFTSGLHMEYYAGDTAGRIYNTLNQRLF